MRCQPIKNRFPKESRFNFAFQNKTFHLNNLVVFTFLVFQVKCCSYFLVTKNNERIIFKFVFVIFFQWKNHFICPKCYLFRWKIIVSVRNVNFSAEQTSFQSVMLTIQTNSTLFSHILFLPGRKVDLTVPIVTIELKCHISWQYVFSYVYYSI